jgi:hypothetical protein
MRNKIATIAAALHSLRPGSLWQYDEENMSSIVWLSEDIEKPSDEEILAEIVRLQVEYEAEEQRLAQQEIERELAKQSALTKLAKLGLTEEEAKAVIGL